MGEGLNVEGVVEVEAGVSSWVWGGSGVEGQPVWSDKGRKVEDNDSH